jgi:hypothetical protein
MHKTILAKAQETFLNEFINHCTHALTLQTNLKTYNVGNQTMRQNISLATEAISRFIPKLNRLLTGNGHRRKQEYLPVIVTSLEGTLNTYDRNRTLHFHLAIGNFDSSRLDVNFLEKALEYWQGTGIGTDDIKLYPLLLGREQGWGRYINKEAYKGNDMCIDFSNTQIPKHLLVD